MITSFSILYDVIEGFDKKKIQKEEINQSFFL